MIVVKTTNLACMLEAAQAELTWCKELVKPKVAKCEFLEASHVKLVLRGQLGKLASTSVLLDSLHQMRH